MNTSKDEAVYFVTKNLGIIDLTNLREDRLLFLNELILAIHRSVAFHNITLLSCNEKERHRPTLEEIKSDMVNGLGLSLLHDRCYYGVPAQSTGLQDRSSS